ncbi:hypothetical protein Tco_1455912 [Tanacetum coccineum]
MVHEAASSFNFEEWEDIQARVQADEELVQRLQVEEREKYTKADQARMLADLINQRKRYFATQRAEERRNKPPIQAQQRSYMSNYIKHIGGYTLQQLRGYSFDEIKTLFETTMRSTGESSELAEEPRDKEADELSQEELQQMMIIVPDQGINIESLPTKYPIIDWEIYTKGTRKYWKIIRVGNHTERSSIQQNQQMKKKERYGEGNRQLRWPVREGVSMLRGTHTMMLVAKLLVNQENGDAIRLLRKIHAG